MTSSDLIILSIAQISEKLEKIPNWNLEDNGKSIRRNFKFNNFKETIYFLNKILEIVEVENHFPDLRIYSSCNLEVNLTTYSVNGLTSKDFEIASKIEEINF